MTRPSGGGRPEWASVFASDGYDVFVELVEKALDREGVTDWRLDGPVARGKAKDGTDVTVGMLDLAQLVARLPRKQWRDVVQSHVENTLASEREVRDLERDAADFAKVSGRLKLRLYPDAPVGVAGDERVTTSRPLEGTLAQLVFDLPSSVVPVRPPHVARWGKALGELEKVALDNVATAADVTRDKLEMQGGGTLETIVSDHFFGATHALLLARHLKTMPPNGALLAVPNRHTVLFHVIEDMTVVTAVNTLVVLAQKYFALGPGSITDQIYWWHASGFTRLPSAIRAGKLEFRPPPEFVRTLNALAAR